VRLIGRSTLHLARIFAGPNGLELYAARDGSAVQVVVRAGGREGSGGAGPDPSLLNLAAVLPDGNLATSDCGHVRFALRATPGDAQMATLQSFALLHPVRADALASPSAGRGAKPAQEISRRPFQLSVSASQSTVDPRPVLSVAIAWAGREQRDAGAAPVE
jgi:hypothetical protein